MRERPRLIESWDARRTALPQELFAVQPNCSDGAWDTGIFARLSGRGNTTLTRNCDLMCSAIQTIRSMVEVVLLDHRKTIEISLVVSAYSWRNRSAGQSAQ
jgi:hypothetical protein